MTNWIESHYHILEENTAVCLAPLFQNIIYVDLLQNKISTFVGQKIYFIKSVVAFLTDF